MTPKALYHTFGCKLNFAETASVERIFEERGVLTAAPHEVPDFIIVNSCSVTAEADRKCRSFIRSLNRRYPKAKILVTGCYAQLKPDEVASLPGVAVVAGINRKLQLADYAEQSLAAAAPVALVPPAKELTDFMPSCSRGDRTRFFLKVQDGCDYWCTYCTIPKARGRSRSGTIADIVAQARQAAEEGGKEIVLTGVNIGDFGHGRDDTFLDLCRELDKVDGIERYRISSIEPNLLTDELIDFTASSRRFMPHFHIPLQCGDDEVLALMHRRYDTALFAAKIERVRRMVPDAFIGVDLIVGARGETPERFENSRSFVESLDISHLHVFPYSERPGTRALAIDHVVGQEEKHRRVAVMTAVSAAKHEAFARRFLGTVRPVLLEHSRKETLMGGLTDNYLRVEVSMPPHLDNTIANLRLDSLKDDGETIIASPAEL
ncbi:MAG: tRNA (N(6)-L-threonylcarbamoyladenosine(37)-C(2))-methylthiotransferase MtaB [Muribaculaceae bacterium]|nr:tRNA (N(6)-L-threonylcarbamoyladenosine(37)-C(2))-methylthiotransferase MtaB [Muribaculaceae bacterium]